MEVILIIVFFWFAVAVIVGVAANTRGRSGVGWFLLALIISPLIAGLMVLALPRFDNPFEAGPIIITDQRTRRPWLRFIQAVLSWALVAVLVGFTYFLFFR